MDKQELRKKIEKLIGQFAPYKHLAEPVKYLVESEFINEGIKYKKISIIVDKSDRVPAYILHPLDIKKKTAGILALHQTTEDSSIGAKEVVGIEGNSHFHYGLELAKLGFTVIAPDYPYFGDYTPSLNTIYKDYGYESMTMKGLINHIASLNILTSLPFVDVQNIGCIGHSLGGTNTLFMAFFDDRIKCSIVSAGFTTFEAYAETSKTKDLAKWSLKEKYMPNTKLKYENNHSLMPFDFHELIASLDPMPIFFSTPTMDEIFDYSGAVKCLKYAKKSYGERASNLIHHSPTTRHDFPDSTRKSSYQFLISILR